MSDCVMRGDIFYANLNRGIGSEQRGYRPVLIIQNNMGNQFSVNSHIILT
jgi:mRNA interferase MazF